MSVGFDSTVRIWDVPARKDTATLQGRGNLRRIAITPDGKRAVVGSSDHTVSLWNLERRKHFADLKGHKHIVAGVAVSPNGKMVATAGFDSVLRLWDISSGKEIAMLQNDEEFRSVTFSADGKLLVGGAGNLVKVWRVVAGGR